MNHAAAAIDHQMQLPRPSPAEQQIARTRRGAGDQPGRRDHCADRLGITAPQRIAPWRLPFRTTCLQRQFDQPDTVQPRRRVAPM